MDRELRKIRCVLGMVIISIAVVLGIEIMARIFPPAILLSVICFLIWIGSLTFMFYLCFKSFGWED